MTVVNGLRLAYRGFVTGLAAGYVWLALIGVLTSVISVFFYLRIIVMMYMTRPAAAASVPDIPLPGVIALASAASAVVYLGVLPARVIEWASRSIAGHITTCRTNRHRCRSC